MSTHSSIACLRQDGSVVATYCHFDGYVSHMVDALNLGHDSYEAALRLAINGEIESIGELFRPDARHLALPSGCERDWTVVKRFDDGEISREYKDIHAYYANVAHDICDSGYRYIWMQDCYGISHWYIWGRITDGAPLKLEKVAYETNPDQ